MAHNIKDRKFKKQFTHLLEVVLRLDNSNGETVIDSWRREEYVLKVTKR